MAKEGLNFVPILASACLLSFTDYYCRRAGTMMLACEPSPTEQVGGFSGALWFACLGVAVVKTAGV